MFKNRTEAGKQLSTKLMDLYQRDELLVLGISRGGMVTAHEVAQQLRAQCDMLTVRKLRVPDHRTEPMGAIAIGGDTVYNHGIIAHFNVTPSVVERVEAEQRDALDVQERQYRGSDASPLDIRGRIILLVDDGMSTGVTMRAAISAMQSHSASEIIVASPVASPQVCMMFQGIADRTTCLTTPRPFVSVSNWYQDFDKPTDDEVREFIRTGQMMPM